MTPFERATEVLVAHQRHSSEACLCGWAELGRSHAAHQVGQLERAGVLAAEIPSPGGEKQ